MKNVLDMGEEELTEYLGTEANILGDFVYKRTGNVPQVAMLVMFNAIAMLAKDTKIPLDDLCEQFSILVRDAYVNLELVQ